MTRLHLTSVLCIGCLLASPTLAVPLESVQPGQIFYLQQMGGNERVQVVFVDYSTRLVEIVREDSTTDWVTADRLLTADASTAAEFQEGAAWATVGAAILCAMVEECRNAVSGQE